MYAFLTRALKISDYEQARGRSNISGINHECSEPGVYRRWRYSRAKDADSVYFDLAFASLRPLPSIQKTSQRLSLGAGVPARHHRDFVSSLLAIL